MAKINKALDPKLNNYYREQARDRYLGIAEKMKRDAGVRKHVIREDLSGLAMPLAEAIWAPRGSTRNQLYILAHECAHVILHKDCNGIPIYYREYQAEVYAHDLMRRHGVSVPKKMTERAKLYVRRKVKQAILRKAKSIHPDVLRYIGLDHMDVNELGVLFRSEDSSRRWAIQDVKRRMMQPVRPEPDDDEAHP